MDELQAFDRCMVHPGEGLGHDDRHAGLRGYCTGLMSPLSRKSVALVEPQRVRSRHQSRHHFVADASGPDEQMLRRVAQRVVPQMDFTDCGWWIINDPGFHHASLSITACGFLLARRLGQSDEVGGKKPCQTSRTRLTRALQASGKSGKRGATNHSSLKHDTVL